MVGVNNRNLGSFVTDVENSFRMARQLHEATHGPHPRSLSPKAASPTPKTICRLRAAGFRVSSSAKPSENSQSGRNLERVHPRQSLN